MQSEPTFDPGSTSEGDHRPEETDDAGFWLWQVTSMEEAVEWVRRCPNPMESDSEI